MVRRLFRIYVVVELAAIVALVSIIGFGWALLVLCDFRRAWDGVLWACLAGRRFVLDWCNCGRASLNRAPH